MCLDLVSGHEQSESFLSQINVFKPKHEFKIQQNITILFHIKIFLFMNVVVNVIFKIYFNNSRCLSDFPISLSIVCSLLFCYILQQ